MATKAASKRLGKEAQLMEKDPPPYCFARPREENVLEWHFILRGPPDTPFHGGEYWGQLLFPSDYPFKPPGIKMSTPSGRFHTDSKICTSMSDFHPGSWNPAWSVANILVGLLSFMCSDEMTTGSFMSTAADRKQLATQSHAFNITQPKFKRLFPEYCKATQQELPNMGEVKKQSVAGSSSNSSSVAPSPRPTAGNGQKVSNAGAVSPTVPTPSSLSSAALKGRTTAPPSMPGLKAASPQAGAATAAGMAAQEQPPPYPTRSKAFFPLLMALLAYLFFSRLASTMSGTQTTTVT